MNGTVRDAQAAAFARAYLESQPDVLAAIRDRKEYGALLLHVSAAVRDHYTAAVVSATHSVLDARLAEMTEQRNAVFAQLTRTLGELERTAAELADLQALWAAG